MGGGGRGGRRHLPGQAYAPAVNLALPLVVFAAWGLVAASMIVMGITGGNDPLARAGVVGLGANLLLLWVTYRRVAR